ncbi:MAG: phytanoyl-CoA dioxygenase family protein [Pseudomonadota bacterium]
MNRLTPAEVHHYHDKGYLVPDFRLSDSWLERVRNALDTLHRDHPNVGLDFVPSPHVPNYVEGVTEYEEWLEFARIPEVLDIVAELIGPDFLMWGSALFGKPGSTGKETPWHQDGEYWPIRPLASCTLWIALDPSTSDNGCLRVLPGSHKKKQIFHHRRNDATGFTLNQVLSDTELNLDDATDVCLEPGQISIHDVYLAHGSAPNRSTQRRAGMTYRYMPTTSHFDHDWALEMTRTMGTTDMSQRPLFLVRGCDRCGQNDLERGHAVYAPYMAANAS